MSLAAQFGEYQMTVWKHSYKSSITNSDYWSLVDILVIKLTNLQLNPWELCPAQRLLSEVHIRSQEPFWLKMDYLEGVPNLTENFRPLNV